MKWFVLYSILLSGLLFGCETVYTPDIEERENVIVADARIIYGQYDNYITLTESLSFNDDSYYFPPAQGGTVFLIDSDGNEYELPETQTGYFHVNFPLNSQISYKIRIQYKGNTFESSYEPVPKVPVLDTVYGIPEIEIVQEGGENNVHDFREKAGAQLYCDIVSEDEMPYYRFTARKIMQYTYPVEVNFFGQILLQTMFAWKSYSPQDIFNIASPPDYSSTKRITKHPLFFLDKKGPVSEDEVFDGWILILYQYGLSKSAHGYYDDLNNQLESEGRLFDPLYVQARSNMECVNDPGQIILGNFEISTIKESRYHVRFISDEKGYLVKPITYFYDIPQSGEQLDEIPDFWESPSKIYPND